MGGITPPYLFKGNIIKVNKNYWYKIEKPEISEGIKMKLTPREREVITLVAEGFADKEIANRLNMSPRTVQTHLNTVINKLSARNRTNAAALFIKKKFQRKIIKTI